MEISSVPTTDRVYSMRCKCCDSLSTTFTLGDYYCTKCALAIRRTIKGYEVPNEDTVDKEYWYVNKD